MELSWTVAKTTKTKDLEMLALYWISIVDLNNSTVINYGFFMMVVENLLLPFVEPEQILDSL